MKLTFNEDDLTLADLEDIEDYARMPFTGLEVDGDGNASLPARMLTALVWVTQRHENPDFTVEDARRVRVSEIEVPSQNGVDPTMAAGATDSKRSRPSATSGT